MAHVSGPTSGLPGSRHAIPEGTRCDNHPERLAKVRIQGETDSFGAEYLDCCQECADRIRQESKDDAKGRCDWCKAEKDTLRPQRDFEEGMYGPVYRVCADCRREENERLQNEYNNYEDFLEGDDD